MSDDDRDIDVESDDDDDDDYRRSASSILQNKTGEFATQADKRAHHNALERRRRDHIKDSFSNLRDSVPSLQGEKSSRAHILKSATEYIQYMSKKNSAVQGSIEDLKKENRALDTQVRALDRAKTAGLYAQQSTNLTLVDEPLQSIENSDSDDSDSDYRIGSNRKKIKT